MARLAQKLLKVLKAPLSSIPAPPPFSGHAPPPVAFTHPSVDLAPVQLGFATQPAPLPNVPTANYVVPIGLDIDSPPALPISLPFPPFGGYFFNAHHAHSISVSHQPMVIDVNDPSPDDMMDIDEDGSDMFPPTSLTAPEQDELISLFSSHCSTFDPLNGSFSLNDYDDPMNSWYPTLFNFSPASSTATLVDPNNDPMDCDLVGPPSWADRSKAKWRAIAELGKRKKKDWLGLKAALASDEDTGRRLKKTKPDGKPGWLKCHRARLAKKRAR